MSRAATFPRSRRPAVPRPPSGAALPPEAR